jgi:hypothetical protein
MLAWERAADPGDLDSLLSETDALWTVLMATDLAPISPLRARGIVIDGWVDAIAAERGVPCIDPLSGLHTAGYLTGRIHELDRAGGPETPPPLVMLVIRWEEPTGPWLRIATILKVADTLRATVRREATLCQDGSHTAIALVPDDGLARVERSAIQRNLDSSPLSAASARCDLMPVPDRRDRLPDMLKRLRTHPSVRAAQQSGQLRMRTGQ